MGVSPVKFDHVQNSILHLEREYSHIRSALRTEKRALASAETHLLDAMEARKIGQIVAQTIQQKAHTQISGIVTKCIQAVFGPAFTFQIIFDQKRGKTEARLVFIRSGIEFNPLLSNGGGMVDVASFGLRLASLVLKKPRARKVLILDEPFKFVSSEYLERVWVILERLSSEMGVQIIMVTHKEELKMGNVIRVK